MGHSTASSGIFFQGDANSHLNSFANSANSLPGNMRSNVSNNILNSVGNSGPSVGASSLVTDANSALSNGGPHLQRSASINNESFMRLPASPMSFSSHNISISGSSVIDSSNQDPIPTQTSATSTARLGQILVAGSYIPEPNNAVSQLHKKPRLDIKQEDMAQQQVLQQIMQRQDSMQIQNHNPHLHALMQHRMRHQQQQQQMIQNLPPVQRAHMIQQQQIQMRQQQQHQLQQQGGVLQQVGGLKRPFDGGGVCSRRLMQYLYHQRQRPPDNSIAYWRKFVTEYYSPRSKKRWCLSLYDNVGHHSLGVFPQAAMDAWQCDLCGSKSGRGFEATFEVLPRLNEIKFGSGVLDELLFLDYPRECRFNNGIMMLEYGKAVQESVYEQLRVVREGQLRVIFTHDLKILSWEFCARRHEELLPRRLVSPQVNQLLQVAHKCQSTIAESGSEGVSHQDLLANSNLVVSAGRQLARSLELHSLNDLGFSKRYVRCLQISEVVNSMKDLMDFCRDKNDGPIDGLKKCPRHPSVGELQQQKTQENEPLGNINTVSVYPGLNPSIIMPHQQSTGRDGSGFSGSDQAAMALSSYQSMIRRQQNPNLSNSMQEGLTSSPFSTTSNPNTPSSVLPPQQQQWLPHQRPGGSSQAMQQHMVQQILHNMNNNNNTSSTGAEQGVNGRSTVNSGGPGQGSGSMSGGPVPSSSSSFKSGNGGGGVNNNNNNSDSSGNGTTSQKVGQGLRQRHHLLSEEIGDIAHDFSENGFFSNSDLEDSMGYAWKA